MVAVLAVGTQPADAGHRVSTRHSPRLSRHAINERRAIAFYTAMQKAYYMPRAGLYGGNPFQPLWPYSQALAATISVTAIRGMHAHYRPGLIDRLRGLETYADHVDPPPAGYLSGVTPPRGSGGPRFNDDNEWIGIELVRLYHINHLPSLLMSAEKIFSMVAAQWDPNSGVACPGGVPFQDIRVNGDRNTVSNAPGAELGVQLYISTGQKAYLEMAKRMYGWVRGCLLEKDGLYADHIDGKGRINATEWTYNQGTMIGAGVMLFTATRDRTYLRQAEATAHVALYSFNHARLVQQPAAFDAIYFRNLLLLGATIGDSRYERAARRFADDAWNNARDRHTNLFRPEPSGEAPLLGQAAMVQMFGLLAERAGTYF